MNNYVFVIDTQKNHALMATPRRARELLNKGKAAVFRRYPFVLILKQEKHAVEPSLELRIDPGSKFTGFALVTPNNEAIWGMELEHRGRQISQTLTKRAGFRRSRRNRNTRYRKKRFNRSKPEGWLAPSLMHRVQTVETWVKRICRYAPVARITIEKVKFDMQKAKTTGLTVKAGSGALAKLVRSKSNLPKAHWIDAACNSIDEQPVTLLTNQPLIVTCKGHGNRQAVRCNASGFPAITVKKDKEGKKIVTVVRPKQTYAHARAGDIVSITLDKDRKYVLAGKYVSRVKTPTAKGVEVKIDGHRLCSNQFAFVHRHDGYDYSFGQCLSV